MILSYEIVLDTNKNNMSIGFLDQLDNGIKVKIGNITFNIEYENNDKILSGFNVWILDNYRGIPELHKYMCKTFSDIYYEKFNDYEFDYIYLNKPFEKLIDRKVKYGKLPKKICEGNKYKRFREKQSHIVSLQKDILKLENQILLYENFIMSKPSYKFFYEIHLKELKKAKEILTIKLENLLVVS